MCCRVNALPVLPKYTGTACILKPKPRRARGITMAGLGEPGMGEKERPGDESLELGFENTVGWLG